MTELQGRESSAGEPLPIDWKLVSERLRCPICGDKAHITSESDGTEGRHVHYFKISREHARELSRSKPSPEPPKVSEEDYHRLKHGWHGWHAQPTTQPERRAAEPIPTDEMPTDREWSEYEWVLNQWYLANEECDSWEADAKEAADELAALREENATCRRKTGSWQRTAIRWKGEIEDLTAKCERLEADADVEMLEAKLGQATAENERLKRDIESGFMKGAYARLQNLQETERKYERLKSNQDQCDGCGERFEDTSEDCSAYCLRCYIRARRWRDYARRVRRQRELLRAECDRRSDMLKIRTAERDELQQFVDNDDMFNEVIADRKQLKAKLDKAVAALEATPKIAEESRQMILLALAELSLRRPGWLDALERVATSLKGREMFDGFRETSADLIKAEIREGPDDE